MRTPFNRPENNELEPDYLHAVNVEKYERCTFCHSKLVFTHDLNISYLQVIETSRCPGCGVTAHPKKFTLQ
jgi:hypothetical protein